MAEDEIENLDQLTRAAVRHYGMGGPFMYDLDRQTVVQILVRLRDAEEVVKAAAYCASPERIEPGDGFADLRDELEGYKNRWGFPSDPDPDDED